MLLLFAASPVATVVEEPIETKIKVEVKTEEEEIGKKKKKRNIMWAADDMLVKYHYYEPDDEERGTIPSKKVPGASVAQWSERSPFTSEVTGSILSENFLNATRSQCSTNVKRVSQHSAESRGFSPGTSVSSHRELTGWVRINTDREAKSQLSQNLLV